MKPIKLIPYEMFLNIYMRDSKIRVSSTAGNYELIEGIISVNRDGSLQGNFLPLFSEEDKKDLIL